ncbi:MAG: hypothetical protein LBC68_03555 [Prevotellaceae bacterium]|jgi:hypothetical protein|nr:hypothetical protein [Prevotellaceae bacterium]
MKTKIIKILNLTAILLLLAGSFSCEKKEITDLPPETQTGANTFGCYVNGELFVKDGTVPFMMPAISAAFQKGNKTLTIESYSKKGYIYIELNNMQKHVAQPISIAYFTSNNEWTKACFCFAGKDIGEIILTKFDTINCIASGRFNFNGQCSDPLFNIQGDSIAHIKDGRFDIKLDIYD